MFRAMGEGRIKAVWIMATNPAVSLPDSNAVRAALARCDFVAVSDCVKNTDTAKFADVLLPAAGWGEKDGTVTNSERRISRQRSFTSAPGEVKPDWWIISEVAQRMGYAAAFDYSCPADIFREHAGLSGFENSGERLFDISTLAGLDDDGYEALKPVQWPVNAANPFGTERLLGNGSFPSADGRAQFIPTKPGIPAYWPASEYPLVMNTGRSRDQWHTMTRTGTAAKLGRHSPEPYVEIGAKDASASGVSDGGLAEITSPLGKAVLRVRINEDQRPGMVFTPMHWNDQYASQAIAGSLIAPATDPVSGQPELKCAPVRVSDAKFRWSGLLVSRRLVSPARFDRIGYWSRRTGNDCHIYQLAGHEDPALAVQWAPEYFRKVLAVRDIEYSDQGRGIYRAVHIGREGIRACLFIGSSPATPYSDWLESLFSQKMLTQESRAAVLFGRPAAGACDNGAIVCACYNVGRTAIVNAILRQGLQSVAAVGAALQAGMNCGSCRPELQVLLSNLAARQDAA